MDGGSRGQHERRTIGAGAAIDMTGGTQTVSPSWARPGGLEWVFRLASDPARLWRRDAEHNLEVVALATLEIMAAALRGSTPGLPMRADGRMRVVILDTSNPDEMTGGQSVFIRNLIPHLDADVKVVGAAVGMETLGIWQRRELGGVEYDFMPVARMLPPGQQPLVPLRLSSLFGVLRFRGRILRAGDVMYVHSPEMGLPLSFGHRRKPIVMHLHGASNPLAVSRYGWARGAALQRSYRALHRHVIRSSRLVVSVDDQGLLLARRSLAAGNNTQLALLPICVDTALFHPGDKESARTSLGLEPSMRLLLFVGRLERAKGTELLIAAFAKLASNRESLMLALIGDGSQRSAMREQAREAGLDARLLFPGWVDHDALPAWLRAADVLLLPSDYEGLPTAVIEALACAVPVVATAVGGLPGLIREGENGLLLRERTSDALAAATAKALDRTWTSQALTGSVAPFTAERVAVRTMELLRQAASSRN